MPSFIESIEEFFKNPRGFRKRIGKPDVKVDPALFMKICHTLHAQAPQNSAVLVMEVDMPPAEKNQPAVDPVFTCFVKKSEARDQKFTISDTAAQQVHRFLIEVRDSMVSQRALPWKSCKLTVDVPMNKYHTDFKY